MKKVPKDGRYERTVKGVTAGPLPKQHSGGSPDAI